MKKKLLLVSILFLMSFFGVCRINAATAHVNIIVDVYTTDYKPWLYVDPCTGYGDKCIVIVVVTVELESTINPLPGGGFSLTTTLPTGSIKKSCVPQDTSDYTIYPNTANYTFPDNSSLRIDECDEFPQLVNISINISGHTTNNNGVLQSYIPPIE